MQTEETEKPNLRVSEREQTIRNRSQLAFVFVAICTVVLSLIQLSVTWPVILELLVFSAAYGALYWLVGKWLFRG